MKSFKYFFIFISLFGALAPSLRAMNQDTKEVNKSKVDEKTSVLSFKAIKKRLAAIDCQGWHFSLQKTKFKKIKNNRIRKTINIWFIDMSDKQKVHKVHIGFITYIVPTKPKDDNGETLHIVMGFIKIFKEDYKRIKLGTLITLAALQDALHTSNDHQYAYAEAINPASNGLFKDKLKFEKSEEFPKCEKLSTEKLPEIMKTYGPKLLEEAFKTLEEAFKTPKDTAKSIQDQ